MELGAASTSLRARVSPRSGAQNTVSAHVRVRVCIAAVQELVNRVTYPAASTGREACTFDIGPGGAIDDALALGGVVRSQCTRGKTSTMLCVDTRSCVGGPQLTRAYRRHVASQEEVWVLANGGSKTIDKLSVEAGTLTGLSAVEDVVGV